MIVLRKDRPIFHHLAAPLKRIASAVSRLDFARQSVGQGELGYVLGYSVQSPTQSRKVDLKPWGTASTSMRRITAVSDISDSGLS